MEQVYVIEYTASILTLEKGVVQSTLKTCVVAGTYDLNKDQVVRDSIDIMKGAVLKAKALKEKNSKEATDGK